MLHLRCFAINVLALFLITTSLGTLCTWDTHSIPNCYISFASKGHGSSLGIPNGGIPIVTTETLGIYLV